MEETITVCGLHRDTVDLLDEVRKEMAKNTAEVAKLNTSLGWIKWVVTGALGVAMTILIAVVPFIMNLNTRIAVLEKWEKATSETTNRGNLQGIDNSSKPGTVHNDRAVDIGIPVGIR